MNRKWVPWHNQQIGTWTAAPGTHEPLIDTYLQEVDAWTTTVVGRSCAGHERRVTTLALKLAEAAGLLLNDRDVRQVVWAGLLHDVGKAAISSKILEKPGPLTAAEFRTIQQHPALGHRLAQTAPQIDDEILGAILHHHEQWNGEGYPMGLIGESIPLLARIIKVADVYDALVSDRPYRAAWTTDEAAAYLLQHSGMAFDPRLIPLFVYRVLPRYPHPGLDFSLE